MCKPGVRGKLYLPEMVLVSDVSDCLGRKKRRFPCCELLSGRCGSTYQTDWIRKGISEHRAMQTKCQKDINILGNGESKTFYMYSVEKAVMIAQMYALVMLCLCNRHITLL